MSGDNGRNFVPLLLCSKTTIKVGYFCQFQYTFFLFVTKRLVKGAFDVLSVYRVLIFSDIHGLSFPAISEPCLWVVG